MRIAIVGAGSLGLLWAARLQQAGCQVMLITRTTEQALAIQQEGIAVQDTEGKSAAKVYIQAQAIAASLGQSPWDADWVMFMVKQHQLTDELLVQVKACMGSRGRWICFQNGIGHMERVAAIASKELVYAAVTTEAALRTSNRHVIHTGKGKTEWGRIALCERNKEELECDFFGVDEEEKKLSVLWREAGFANEVSNDIDTAIWNKLLVNACINPITAILHIRNGELLQLPHARSLMRELLEEAWKVARAQQKPLILEQIWERLIQVCKATSDNRSSMLQDIRRGRVTEIDAITGALLLEAEKQNLDLPTHRTVYRMVKALEGRRDIDTVERLVN